MSNDNGNTTESPDSVSNSENNEPVIVSSLPLYAEVCSPTDLKSRAQVIREATDRVLKENKGGVTAQVLKTLQPRNRAGTVQMAHGKAAELVIERSKLLTAMNHDDLTYYQFWHHLHTVLVKARYVFERGYIIGNTRDEQIADESEETTPA